MSPLPVNAAACSTWVAFLRFRGFWKSPCGLTMWRVCGVLAILAAGRAKYLVHLLLVQVGWLVFQTRGLLFVDALQEPPMAVRSLNPFAIRASRLVSAMPERQSSLKTGSPLRTREASRLTLTANSAKSIGNLTRGQPPHPSPPLPSYSLVSLHCGRTAVGATPRVQHMRHQL